MIQSPNALMQPGAAPSQPMGAPGGSPANTPPQLAPGAGAGMQPQVNGLMPPPVQQPAPPPPSPMQIQDFHTKLSDHQKMLDELIKQPDEQLTLKHVFGAASDMVTKNRLSGGKHGASGIEIAQELASKDFPPGDNPTPQQLRAFLQRHFDKAVMKQAFITSKFGPPNVGLQNAPATLGNNLTSVQGQQS